MSDKVKYLRLLYLTVLVAAVLSTWPNSNWLVRFLCYMLFAILAAWADRAGVKMQQKLRGAANERQAE